VQQKLVVDEATGHNAPAAPAVATLGHLIIEAAGFSAVFLLGRFLAVRVRLPFSNPDGIIGTLAAIRYNPANNIVRFLLITLFPTGALAAFFLLARGALVSWLFPLPLPEVSDEPGPRTVAWGWFLLPVVIVTALLVGLDSPSYMSVGSLEPFEEGLPLSAGMSYLSGGTPYRDFVFFHGLYDEPLRIAVSFKLFGHSIGAMRTLQSINKIVTFGLLAWFLFRLFRGNAASCVFALFALYWLEPAQEVLRQRAGIMHLHSVMIISRDMFLFAFLVVLTFLADKVRRPESAEKGIFWIAMVWSATPALGFIHSMERGIYLLVVFAVIVPVCYFLFFRGQPAAAPFLTGCAIGFFLSALLFTVLIRGAFAELGRFIALLVSNAVQLQFGYPYPVLDRPYTLIGLMMAFSCFWIFRMFFIHLRSGNGIVESIRGFLRKNFMEAALLFVSMLFYRNALGRTDWIHVAYVLSAPTILFLFVVIRHLFMPLSREIAIEKFARLKIAFVALFWIAAAGQGWILLGNVWRKDLLNENFPLAKDDSQYLPAPWKPVVSFLRQNLSPDESFYTLSDELSIYYFVGKPCPVRFPLLNMVVKNEQYQREIIADLEAHRVKYVVVDPQSDPFKFDGYSNELRAPLVFEYVRAHYQQYLDMDGQLIFARKGG